MTTRCVILGTGIAGLSAAEAIRSENPQATITLIGDESGPLYSRPGLAYLLTGEVAEELLAIRTPQELDALNVRRITQRVTRLDLASRSVVLADGQRVPYDALLIAVGAASLPAGFAGEELDGVVRLDGLDEARDFVKRAEHAKNAVVIGGGSTALELVEGLHARGVRTTYLLRGDRYWSRVFDETESAMVETQLLRANVALRRQCAVKRAIGRDGKLVAIETTTGETIACDLLAVAVGIKPRLELARDAGLKTDRGIVVNAFLESSVEGVYAAGDVAQVYDPITGESQLDTLWPSAQGQGRVAGLNMAGRHVPYRKRIPMNITRVAGITATIIGAVGGHDDPDLMTLTRGQSERWASAPDAWAVSGARVGDRLRVMVSRNAIVGAVVMGDQRASHALAHLIGESVDISKLRPALEADPAKAMDILLEFCASHVRDEEARHG